MAKRLVWVRVMGNSEEPIGFEIDGSKPVCSISEKTKDLEKLDVVFSRLSLSYSDDVTKRIRNDEKVINLKDDISMDNPLVLHVKSEKPIPTQYVTPSSISKNWSFYQSEYKINFNCPPDPITSNPYACIYFEPFADFIEQMTGGFHENDPGNKFLDVANRLVYQMSELEAKRQEKVIMILNPICPFSSYTCKSSKHAIQSDLSVTYTNGVVEFVIANMELKNDLEEGGKSENFQQAGYYLHFSSEAIQALEGDLAPMLLVSMVGHAYLQAFAGYRNERNEPCIDSISEPVSLKYDPADMFKTVKKVAIFLKSMESLIVALEDYYRQAFLKRQKPRIAKEGYPYFNYENNLLFEKRICRSVFRGLLNGQLVVVKFVHDRYGLEVHKHFASKGLAPTIIHHQKLKGDWQVVVMTYVKSSCEISDLSNPKKRKIAQRILDAFDAKNYVHGDLRLPNLIISDETEDIMLLDFDWAGIADQVKYPDNLNIFDINWPHGVCAGAKIMKKHDEEMLFKQLQIDFD